MKYETAEHTTFEVITSAERNQIAGRFILVGKGDNWRVVGTVGSLWPHDLNRRQRQFIAAWHFPEQDGKYSFEILDSYQDSTLPEANFNGFLRITKGA
jgi:hypothetical protein